MAFNQKKSERNSGLKRYLLPALLVVFLFAGVVYAVMYSNNPKVSEGPLDDFAKCLSNNGAVMYGTEWCSHCQNQKKMFGSSFSEVNFVDCDVSAGICAAEGITGYPTWKFADGSRVSGTQDISALAQRASCAI